MESQQPITNKEKYEVKRQEKMGDIRMAERRHLFLKVIYWGSGIIAAVVVIGGLFWFLATRPNLPPITMENHTEIMPQSHITDQSMPDSMQRHMLEHADGKTKPGIVIQYNCKKYSCESDLVAKLTDLVKKYPDNVYLAPNNYDGKIILTKLGKIEILAGFDEQKIKSFIEQ